MHVPSTVTAPGTSRGALSIRMLAGVSLVALVMAPFGAIAHAATIQKIVVSGDSAPGIPGAVISTDILSYLELFPTIDDAGNVAFLARLDGDGIDETNRSAVWAGSATSPTLMARTGSQAPGEADGVVFAGFPQAFTDLSPTISAGRVALTASVAGPGITPADDIGVWTGSTDVDRMAREGTVVPGSPEMTFSSVHGTLGSPGGGIVLSAEVIGSGITSTNDEGFWVEQGGVLESILHEGDAAPGEDPGVVIGGAGQFIGTGYNFTYPQVHTGGFSVLSTVIGPGIDDYSNEVLVAVRNGVVEIIAREGQQAAGMAPNVVYGTGIRAGFSALSLDALGHEAFFVRVGGGAHAYETITFSSHVDGILRPVLYPFDEAPGTDGDAFAVIGRPVLNPAGYLAFTSSLASDTGFYPPFGLWWDRPGPRGEWSAVVVPGQPLPEDPAITITGTSGIHAFSASGHLTFGASLDDPVIGFRKVVLGADPTGQVNVLLSTRVPFDVHGDGTDLREVEDFVVGAVNAQGVIAVRIDFTDESFGYYTITPGAVVAAGEAPALADPRLVVMGRNPFRAGTRVGFNLQAAATARLDLFDVGGRRVAELLDGGVRTAGIHEVRWDGRDVSGAQVAPGVYWARLQLDGRTSASVRLVRTGVTY